MPATLLYLQSLPGKDNFLPTADTSNEVDYIYKDYIVLLFAQHGKLILSVDGTNLSIPQLRKQEILSILLEKKTRSSNKPLKDGSNPPTSSIALRPNENTTGLRGLCLIMQ